MRASPKNRRASGRSAWIGAALLFIAGALAAAAPAGASDGSCLKLRHAGEALVGGSLGRSVAMDGEWAVVGEPHMAPQAPGTAYVFRYVDGEWTLWQTLTPSDSSGGDVFGGRVAMRGSLIVALATGGRTYVFRNVGDTWIEEQKLQPWETSSSFGSVAVSDDRIAGGAHNEPHPGGDGDPVEGTGVVYVFRHDGSQWVPEQKILADDPVGVWAFGRAVAIMGEFLAVGVHNDNNTPPTSPRGGVYVFKHDFASGTWVQHQRIKPPTTEETDGIVISHRFGHRVDFSGQTLFVGSNDPSVHKNSPCGHSLCGFAAWYDYDPDDDLWKLSHYYLSDDWNIRRVGDGVSIDGDRAVAGAPNSIADGLSGAAVAFERGEDGIWRETALLLPKPNPSGSSFGRAVAVSGDWAIVGAHVEDNLRGAAYFFRLGPTPGDLTCDGEVHIIDLLELLNSWGACASDYQCPADLNGDGVVDVSDLLILLNNWG